MTLFGCSGKSPAAAWKEKDIPAPVQRQLDSLYLAARNASPDSVLGICAKVRSVAAVHDCVSAHFRAYCVTAKVHSFYKNDLPEGERFMDSAALLMRKRNRPDLLPTLHLYHAAIHKYDDSSVYYIEKALQHVADLQLEDRLLALAVYAAQQNIHTNYVQGRQYALMFLYLNKESRSFDRLIDEVAVLNTLAIVEYKLDRIETSVAYLKRAEKLIADSLGESAPVSKIYQNLGGYYVDRNMPDSAQHYFEKFKNIVDRDFTYGGQFRTRLFFAQVALLRKDYTSARRLLEEAALVSGDTAGQIITEVNELDFLSEFWNAVYRLNKATGNYREALSAQEREQVYRARIEKQRKRDDILKYEKRIAQVRTEKALAEKEESLSRQKSISLLLVAGSSLLLITAVVTVLYLRKKKQLESRKYIELQQKTELERATLLLQAESSERRRIARELHDELGSTLTSIRLAVEVLKQHHSAALIPLEILERNSHKLTRQANEIVWSLNDSNDNLESLLAHIYNHCAEFLEDAGIALLHRLPTAIPGYLIEGYRRRCIFQTVKEVVNNAVRHSGCTQITMLAEISCKDRFPLLKIVIADNGRGFTDTHERPGNGLKNIQNNMAAIEGSAEWDAGSGVTVTLNIPLPALAPDEKKSMILPQRNT